MKTETKAVNVYRDLEYAANTRQQLEAARLSMQNLLDIWNGLNLGECSDISQLLLQTERTYKSAVDKLVEVPAPSGRFAVKKEAILSTLDLPDPSQLYATAKVTRQQSFCAVPELWQVNNNKVELVESEAFYIVDARSIYASNPEAVKLARDMNKLCELYNSLNERLTGDLIQASPWAYNFLRGKFVLSQKVNNGYYQIDLDIEYLRQVLQRF